MMVSSAPLRLEDVGADIIYEVLGHLNIEDVIQIRQVCRKFKEATEERRVWDILYRRSELLLPEGPYPYQESLELEKILIRATKMRRRWGSTVERPSTLCNNFTFPRVLPSYTFAAQIISGRYLQLAEQGGISWYDLEGDYCNPILTFQCQYVTTVAGYLQFQVKNMGEKPGWIWVTFVCSYPMRIMILKVRLGLPTPTVELEAILPAECIVEFELGADYVLPIKEFNSPDTPMDMFHIPSRKMFRIPMHERVRNLSDLNYMNYVLTPRYLLLMFSLKSETHMEVYTLPETVDPSQESRVTSCPYLSHRGIYPHAISKINLFNTKTISQCNSDTVTDSVTFLAVVYMRQPTATWTSKVALHLFDVKLCASGMLDFSTECSQTLDVGIAATTLASTSRNGLGLAVTHSSPGPVIRTYYIQHGAGDEESSMTVKALKLPTGLQSRELLAFDGYRGRLCLVHGWTHIEVMDYA